MTIRTKDPEVSSSFPPARLFLDDIEEIVRILREFIETQKLESSRSHGEDPKTRVSFSAGGRECDDVQDLPKIAKRYRELSITVTKGGWPESSLTLNPMFTLWRSSGLRKEDTWAAFHKLQVVFEKRSRRWGTLIRSIPWWLRWSLYVAAVWLTPFVRFPLYKLMPHGAADVITLLLYGVLIAAAGIGALNTTLALRHSWDPPPFRQYVKDKLIPVVAGAVIGIGGTVLAMYLKHKYWP